MIQAPEIFTTPRLILRRSRLADAEAIFEYAERSARGDAPKGSRAKRDRIFENF
jgi:hypothetical protein